MQFDATTEQLNHMMQELVVKMSGQEQDWQKMLDRLLSEMDSKVRAGRLQGPWTRPRPPSPARRAPTRRAPTRRLRAHQVPPARSWTAWSWTP